MAREGREAYAAHDYDTAFMRFKQGVELVNWVEAKDAVRQRCIDDMYCMFLRNVAQAALKLERYQEAIRESVPPLADSVEFGALAAAVELFQVQSCSFEAFLQPEVSSLGHGLCVLSRCLHDHHSTA